MSESSNPTRAVLSVTVGVKDNDELLEVGLTGLAIGQSDGDKRQSLQLALNDLVQQDPTLVVIPGPSDGQFTLAGMSEPHLEENLCRISYHNYKIEIEVGEPQVLYLETIQRETEAEGKYIRQTGGIGNYGHCKIRLTPGERGNGYEFTNGIRNEAIPEQYIEVIDQGIRDSMQGGILAGCPVADVTVTLYDGSYHAKDSNEMAFKIAASMAFKEAARKAHPILLEPVMAVQTLVPEEYMGIVIADLNNRRGRIERTEYHARLRRQWVHATVPLSAVLRSSTYGNTKYFMRFARYEPVPHDIDSGDDAASIPAIKPNLPITGLRSASVSLDTQFD